VECPSDIEEEEDEEDPSNGTSDPGIHHCSVCLSTDLHSAQEFFTDMATHHNVKGCKTLAFARRSGPLSMGDLYRVKLIRYQF
jgi:hypothetical protein